MDSTSRFFITEFGSTKFNIFQNLGDLGNLYSMPKVLDSVEPDDCMFTSVIDAEGLQSFFSSHFKRFELHSSDLWPRLRS